MFIIDLIIRILPKIFILFSLSFIKTKILGKNPNIGGKPLMLPKEKKIAQFIV